jgi:hypothetical protein
MPVPDLHDAHGRQRVLPEGLGQLKGVQQARVQDGPPHLAALCPDCGPPVPSTGGPRILPPWDPDVPAKAESDDGKVVTGITFKSGSNHMVFTEDYPRRMRLKKIKSSYPVFGFESPCSLSLWRMVRGIKLTSLASCTHGLFIT